MNRNIPIAFGTMLAAVAASCTTAPDAAGPPPRPLGSELAVFRPPSDIRATRITHPPMEEPEGELTLRQALEMALASNPDLIASGWGIRSADARVRQQRLFPNPELETEVEEFSGSGDLRGFDAAEYTLALSQEFALGGKRGKAVRTAALERDLAGWDFESRRLDVITAVRQAFADVLAAQQRVILSEELVRLAGESQESTELRVKAGAASAVENLKAQVELSALGIERDNAREALASARKSLAATWGNPSPNFKSAAGSLEELSPLPPEALMREQLGNNPDVARWSAELKLREAMVEQEKAARVSNVTAGGGVKWLAESDDQALIASATLPLPLFDRNQGAIHSAQYEVARAREETRAAEAAAAAALAATYQGLATAHREATTLKTDLLPLAEASFEQTRQGYQQGRLGYLEVLDAQRTLFEARGQYLEALTDYQKARADAERLVGASLDSLSNEPEQKE